MASVPSIRISSAAAGALAAHDPVGTLFTPAERAYVRSLKRRARARLEDEALRLVRTAKRHDEPLRIRVLRSELPDAFKQHLFHTLRTEDGDKVHELAQFALRLPFGKMARPAPDVGGCMLRRARDLMDREVHGHANAKREVLALLAQTYSGGGGPRHAIALEGEPGVGKTTFVKRALAAALDRPMVVTCLGGVSDASFLQGHGYTYQDSRPGRLAESLCEAGVLNPVLFFDELDKVSNSARGDEILNCLIHLTDPMQNHSIHDRFLGNHLDLDFSRCLVVFSYNDARRVASPVLLDRLKRIRMDAPTAADKVEIARRHLLPRARSAVGCDARVDDSALREIVASRGKEPGLRGVEHAIDEVLAMALICDQLGCAPLEVGSRVDEGGSDAEEETGEEGTEEEETEEENDDGAGRGTKRRRACCGGPRRCDLVVDDAFVRDVFRARGAANDAAPPPSMYS